MFYKEQKLSFTELYVIRCCQGSSVMFGCIRTSTVAGQRNTEFHQLVYSFMFFNVTSRDCCKDAMMTGTNGILLETGYRGFDTQPQELWQALKDFMWPSA